MRLLHDPDEYEQVTTSKPCTVCDGDLTKCNGGCNGMVSYRLVRRSDAEIKRIKAEKERAREDAVLSEADEIRRRRALSSA